MAGLSVGQSIGLAVGRPLSQPGAGGGSPEFSVQPTFAIYSADNVLSDGSVVANRYASTPPNENIMNLSTGYIRSAGGSATLTNFFAEGPGGETTATRLEFSTDATVFSIYAGAPPAGDYRLTLKAKLNSGGPTKSIRHGNVTAGYITTEVNDSTWTACTVDFTATGSNYTPFNIIPAVGASPVDLLIDEVQWYTNANLPQPVFSEEANDWHFKIRNKGYAGAIARTGNLLNNATGGSVGPVLNPDFPAAKTFTEFTALVAFRYLTVGIGYMLVPETDATLGTTANTVQIGTTNGSSILGQIQFQPVNAGSSRIETHGEGWHIYALRIRSGNRQCFFNGIELNSATSAWSGFQARLLNIGGQTTAAPSRGDFGIIAVWDSYLSDEELAQAHRKVEADIVAMGEERGALPYFYIAEGDSISASTVSPQGPAYPYLLAAADYFTGKPPLYLRNRSVSASGIVALESRKALNLTVIAQAIAAGAQPIVSILVGTNDTAEIGTDGYLAYWAKLESLYADYRAAGALVVAATLLPANVGNPAFDTERALLNAYMRTQTGAYDALADLAADPDIGPDSAPAAGTYYDDTIHLNTAGQVIAAGIFKIAMESIGV